MGIFSLIFKPLKWASQSGGGGGCLGYIVVSIMTIFSCHPNADEQGIFDGIFASR
jgi:hypothetical protein